MAALANILPITFLASFCLLVLLLLAYYCWRRAFPQRVGPNLENPEYEVEEIPGTTDFVMVGRKGDRKKKIKKPKLWEIWAPNPGGRVTHERKLSSGSSVSDLSMSKDAGCWAELKPVTVTYVKNPNKSHIPPIPTHPIHPSMGPIPEPTAITMDGNTLLRDLSNSSRSSLSQLPSRDIPPGPTPGPPPAETLAAELVNRTSNGKKRESVGGYDKSTIEAVQVSVLISMPQRQTPTNHHTTESTGPLELGVVHIPLGHSAPKWAARRSIRPPPQ